jgi:hypothetical protein
MKTTRFLLLLAGCLVSGCAKESTPPATATNTPAANPPPPPPAAEQRPAGRADGNPLNAAADYGGVLARSKRLAEKTVDAAALNQAIQMFHASEGRFPQSLNELVSQQYLPQLPVPPAGMKFDYNPNTGELKVVAR